MSLALLVGPLSAGNSAELLAKGVSAAIGAAETGSARRSATAAQQSARLVATARATLAVKKAALPGRTDGQTVALQFVIIKMEGQTPVAAWIIRRVNNPRT